MKVQVIRNFISDDLLDLLNIQVAFFKSPVGKTIGVNEDRSVFFRKQVNEPALFKAVHHILFKKFRYHFPEEIKPSYCFVSMYEDDRSICPLHTDRSQCKYTIDLCLNQKEPWEIFINDEPYLLNPGDAVLYSGTDHPHYRNKIKEGNFCDLAFFHFVPVNFEGDLN